MKLTTKSKPLSSGKSVRFVELSSAAMTALLDGSLADASSEAGIVLTPYFLADDGQRLWRLHVSQIAANLTPHSQNQRDSRTQRWTAVVLDASRPIPFIKSIRDNV